MANSNNKFKIVKDNRGRVMINDVFLNVMGGNDVKFGENIYELTPQFQKALTETSYNFDEMSDKDIISFNRIQCEINYNPNDDRKSKRRDYLRDKLQSRVQTILNPPKASIASRESDEYESLESDIEGNVTKINVIPEKSDEIWTTLQVPLGLKLAGHTDT